MLTKHAWAAGPVDSAERGETQTDGSSTRAPLSSGPGAPVVAVEPGDHHSCVVHVCLMSSSAIWSLSSVTLPCRQVNLEANVGYLGGKCAHHQ